MSNPFNLGGMSNMLAGFQQKMKEIQEESQKSQYTATSGGVTVVVNGSNEVISIEIDDESMKDKELLEDILLVVRLTKHKYKPNKTFNRKCPINCRSSNSTRDAWILN